MEISPKNHVFKVSKYLIIINHLTINASETNTTVKLAYKINNKKHKIKKNLFKINLFVMKFGC